MLSSTSPPAYISFFSEYLGQSTKMFSSTISVPNISKEVTNMMIPPPPGQVEKEDQLILIENVVDTSPKRMSGIGRTVPRLEIGGPELTVYR